MTEIAVLLDASGRAIDALVSGVSPEAARWSPEPGKWSIHEILGHLADEERNVFRARIDYMLHRPGEAWPAIDPQRTVREGNFNEKTLDTLRTDFLLERQKSLAWLSGLRDANWAAAYHHPKMGDFTAVSMLDAWAAHDLLHLRQIERILWFSISSVPRPRIVPTTRASGEREARIAGAEGAEIAARISRDAFDYLDAPVVRVGSKEVPLPYSESLEQYALPWAKDVVAAVKATLA